jgi:hypothetical protein
MVPVAFMQQKVLGGRGSERGKLRQETCTLINYSGKATGLELLLLQVYIVVLPQ